MAGIPPKKTAQAVFNPHFTQNLLLVRDAWKSADCRIQNFQDLQTYSVKGKPREVMYDFSESHAVCW